MRDEIKDKIIRRICTRLEGEEVEENVVEELAVTVSDRLCIRLGEEALPEPFHSICVDAAVKMGRRMYYEGISSEETSNISTSFVEDILSEYDEEIAAWKERKMNTGGSGRVVRFL